MLLVLLVAGLSLGVAGLFVGIIREAAKTNQLVPKPEALGLAAVTNFFDTLGIGSFAPTIAWFRFRKMVPDRLMPLTMFIGYTIPAILQGVIFLILLGVRVDPLLLLGCVIAIVIGGYVGGPIASRSLSVTAWLRSASDVSPMHSCGAPSIPRCAAGSLFSPRWASRCRGASFARSRSGEAR